VTRSGRILTLNLESKTRPDLTLVARYDDDGRFAVVTEEQTAQAQEAVYANLTGWNTAMRLSITTGMPLGLVMDSLEAAVAEGKVVKRMEGDPDAAVAFYARA
jgi:hypothetical protein